MSAPDDSWTRWAEDPDAPMPTRRTRHAMRYDGCTPTEAERIRRERERLTRVIAWAVIGLVLASFAAPFVERAL